MKNTGAKKCKYHSKQSKYHRKAYLKYLKKRII